MVRRAASIWRAVTQPGSSACKPYSPKEISTPRDSLPFMRPRICLRYFTRFGINITATSFIRDQRIVSGMSGGILPSSTFQSLFTHVYAFGGFSLFFHFGLHLTVVHPNLDPNLAIGGGSLCP